jgi:hypothetical protein
MLKYLSPQDGLTSLWEGLPSTTGGGISSLGWRAKRLKFWDIESALFAEVTLNF